MRLHLTAIALLLCAAVLPPRSWTAETVQAGATAERYSFDGPGNSWWLLGRVPFGVWTALARLEHLRRFGDLDTAAAAGLAWKGAKRGGAIWVGLSPGADILARDSVELSW